MDNNYIFFEENLNNLVKEYDGKFVVIKDQCVIGAYDSFDKAYMETTETEELGCFIIQQCTPDALKPSANFAWNNVAFSSVPA